MGASQEVILSLAPKSVTTPIAMEVTKPIGGIPSLTAAVVVWAIVSPEDNKAAENNILRVFFISNLTLFKG